MIALQIYFLQFMRHQRFSFWAGLYWIGKLLMLSQLSSSPGCNMSILIDFEHCIICPHRILLCYTLQCCHCSVFSCGYFPSQTTFASIYTRQTFSQRMWSACNSGTGISQEILECKYSPWVVLEQELLNGAEYRENSASCLLTVVGD